ncbi:Oidioi.mRNA.OKI2018_I69.chr2.g6732.t1.cds [Oikopleura dioica]|uniref:Oidioi.mRNA.OKI2018_I69.chr2.g6732.t1.cds n=1 Tax=Oikopleura dioica TaxID=34765 RepID=A0ABN7T8R5_OIKDI|nr:Oidioi.mRNA.OKI2018_I69.chr2.g6732.t1.cds [Oikopleura dioica]
MTSDSELEEIIAPAKEFANKKKQKIPEELREWIEPVLWNYNKNCMKSQHREDRKPLLLRNYRDLEDGFIVAVMIRDYCPKVVQTHNLTRTLKRASKVDNWAFVSQRLWSKTGFNLSQLTIEKILDHNSSVLFDFLFELKEFLDARFPKDQEGSDKSSEIAYVDVEKYIPSVLDSPKAKKPLSKINNVKVLDKKAKSALQRNDTIFKNNRKCVQELKARFNSLQSDVQERNNEIIMLETSARSVPSPHPSQSSKKKGCCCVIS